MTAKLIDGKKWGEVIKAEVKAEVEEIKNKTGRVPGLAVILVGDRKDSQTYVRMKQKSAAEVGIKSVLISLPADVSQERVIEEVEKLNNDDDIHGILIQLPMPAHINEEEVLSRVKLEKDVDGFHPVNIGRLSMKGREPLFVPCTPKGCIELLLREGVQIEGKHAVVIGRSNIVGLPVAMLLLGKNATVTIVHSRTKNVPEIVKQADILVAALGRAEYVKADWIKPGAVVIDVGINPVDDPKAKQGYRLVGDVEFEKAKEVASLITPVPGGVGPMTIAMLMKNTLEAGKHKLLKN